MSLEASKTKCLSIVFPTFYFPFYVHFMSIFRCLNLGLAVSFSVGKSFGCRLVDGVWLNPGVS